MRCIFFDSMCDAQKLMSNADTSVQCLLGLWQDWHERIEVKDRGGLWIKARVIFFHLKIKVCNYGQAPMLVWLKIDRNEQVLSCRLDFPPKEPHDSLVIKTIRIDKLRIQKGIANHKWIFLVLLYGFKNCDHQLNHLIIKVSSLSKWIQCILRIYLIIQGGNLFW